MRARLGLVDGLVEPVIDEQSLAGPVVVEPVQANSTWPLVIRRPRCSPATASRVWASSKMATSYSGRRLAPVPREGQVAHEQGVVDDQDVGGPHPPPGLVVEAVAVPRALLAQAVAVLAGHGVPDRRRAA